MQDDTKAMIGTGAGGTTGAAGTTTAIVYGGSLTGWSGPSIMTGLKFLGLGSMKCGVVAAGGIPVVAALGGFGIYKLGKHNSWW